MKYAKVPVGLRSYEECFEITGIKWNKGAAERERK